MNVCIHVCRGTCTAVLYSSTGTVQYSTGTVHIYYFLIYDRSYIIPHCLFLLPCQSAVTHVSESIFYIVVDTFFLLFLALSFLHCRQTLSLVLQLHIFNFLP